ADLARWAARPAVAHPSAAEQEEAVAPQVGAERDGGEAVPDQLVGHQRDAAGRQRHQREDGGEEQRAPDQKADRYQRPSRRTSSMVSLLVASGPNRKWSA